MSYRDSPTTFDSNRLCINDVPNELLASIFNTVTNGGRYPGKLPSTPVLLSKVCSHRRMLARNIPEIWVSIVVPPTKSPEHCIAWIAEWIARSGVLLISITMTLIDARVALAGIIWQDFDFHNFVSELDQIPLSGRHLEPAKNQHPGIARWSFIQTAGVIKR